MESTAGQNITQADVLDRDRQMIGKETGSWFDQKDTNENREQSLSFESPYYKCKDTIDNPVDASSVPWWKDASASNANVQPEYQQGAIVAPPSYPLISHCTDTQISQIQQLELNTKKPTKSKQLKPVKEHREPIKRTQHPELWKVNIKKNARLRGEEYVGVGGKIVPAKAMGPPCKCRMRCYGKIDESARKELHNIFWKTCNWIQRKQYVALSVKESPKQRTRCRGKVKSEHRRQVTFTYSLLLKGEFVTVCKSMFLSTFAISEKFVRHVMNKKRTSPGGVIEPDQRGRHTPKTKKSEYVKDRVREHIKSFPTENSTNSEDSAGTKYLDSSLSIAAMHKLYVSKCKEEGIPENEIVKESYYREMFRTEFNLGFKPATSRENKQSLNVTCNDNAIRG